MSRTGKYNNTKSIDNMEEKVEKKIENNNQDVLVNNVATNNKVIIYCKNPHGLLFDLGNKKSVYINGNAENLRGLPKGILPSSGFGMTLVECDAWEYIKKNYSGMRIFKSGLIFASADKSEGEAKAKANDVIKSGFEPISIGKEAKIEDLKSVEEDKSKDI